MFGKTFFSLALPLLIGAAHAQGTINFNTRFDSAGVNAPVEIQSQFFMGGPGPAYSAALYLVGAGNSLSLIPSSLTTFRDGSENPLFAKYVVPVVAEVPGAPVGSTITVRMRAWRTDFGSYEAAQWPKGETFDLQIRNLGGGPIPPADLPASFTGMVITEPEPSTLAVAFLGAAMLLGARRLRNPAPRD